MAVTILSNSGPTIIYVSSKRCLELAQMIYDSGYLTGIYHGDLSYQERQTVQQQFLIMTSRYSSNKCFWNGNK